MGMAFKGRHRLCHQGGLGLIFKKHRALIKQAKTGKTHPACQRIAGIAVGMEEGFCAPVVIKEGIVNRPGGQGRRQGHVAPGQPLGQTEKIRGDVRLFRGEKRPGPTKAHRDFIGYQVHLIALARRLQKGKVNRVIHAHAPRALDQWLDNDGRGGLGMPLQQGLHRLEGFARMGLCRHPGRSGKTGRTFSPKAFHQEGAIGLPIERHITHGQGAKGLAVIAVLKGNEPRLLGPPLIAPSVVAHLEGHLDRRGAVVRIETVIQSLRADTHQRLGQLNGRCVGEAG